jgi:3-oxoacyl-[acyl-carrier protein] reductase
MDLGLANATVIVAGGTTGMGRAAAECFAEDGARVAILARSEAGLRETCDVLTKLGSPDAVGIATDLFDSASVNAAVEQVGERWGHLNALVNAGGPMHGGLKTFETYADDEWHDVFDGLTLAAVRTIRAALPLLRLADWARVVNVSAMSTKHQSSLTKNLSQSLAPDGILVNTVSPGTFASESFKAALAQMPGVDENDLKDIMRFIKEGFGHHVFLDRAADPSEIGPVIAFAASARNTYMTGANLNVDGGSDFT